jgi:hypothetical protein
MTYGITKKRRRNDSASQRKEEEMTRANLNVGM